MDRFSFMRNGLIGLGLLGILIGCKPNSMPSQNLDALALPTFQDITLKNTDHPQAKRCNEPSYCVEFVD